jgi:hypothetical protein
MKNNKYSSTISISTDCPVSKEPLVKGWRARLIKKLGGHVLTEEEYNFLLAELWIPALQKKYDEQFDKEAAEVLENAWTITYVD